MAFLDVNDVAGDRFADALVGAAGLVARDVHRHDPRQHR
jgi:hypothetical protein